MLLKVIESGTERGWKRIVAVGEIDISSAPVLDSSVAEAIASGDSQIAIDLNSVSFMDSTGLRLLISASQRLDARGGSLAVVAGPGPARRLLELAGTMRSLYVVDSTADLRSV